LYDTTKYPLDTILVDLETRSLVIGTLECIEINYWEEGKSDIGEEEEIREGLDYIG
jgi:hypothetical protein